VATYALIHGASSDAWYWHRVVPELRARGHEVVAPDLPSDDDRCDFTDYAAVVVDALGEVDGSADDLIVVGQSMGGFTAPLVCAELPARLLVLVAAMVPLPGEVAGEWWDNTGWIAMRGDNPVDVMHDFFHDVPADVTEAAMARGERAQSGTPFAKPWPLAAWPDVPTRFVLCRDDRFFPANFQRRVVRERLGMTPDEIDSGHLPALAHPVELVDQLERYRREIG
jgi:pimeloyl-ACP methyl ester carboxylesterase